MPDRRAALVDAGIDLVLQQCFQDLLSSVDTRSITARAGVTTGSFFHHFRNRAVFTEAVIERLQELWGESTQRSLGAIEGFASGIGFDDAAAAEWDRLETERRNAGLQHLLLAVFDQPVSEGSTRTAGDVLSDRYQALHAAVEPAYARGLEVLGREMMPPFTEHDLAVVMAAIGGGLKTRHLAQPGAVREGLYADLVTALVISVTRPVGERAEVREVGSPEHPLQITSPDSSSARAEPDTWHHIASAAAPLFVDRRVGEVKVAEIAAAAGVSPSTVYHQFGTVTAVAAAGWAILLPELQAVATRPLTAEEGPIVRMEQVLTRFIQLGRSNRGALEGLMFEVVAGSPRPRMVPLGTLLQPHIRELRTRGLLRRRIDSQALARSAFQLTAMRVLNGPDEPEERIVDDTLGMLLEGALAGGGR